MAVLRAGQIVLLTAWLALLGGGVWAMAGFIQDGAGEVGVSLVQLPPEARRTLVLIRQGGPFPYRKDGTVFGNREGLLPNQARGYYREYTVPTPGLSHRGARRIVAGRSGEYYYTADHYRTFQRIRE